MLGHLFLLDDRDDVPVDLVLIVAVFAGLRGGPVAGLLTGKDYLNVTDRIVGDFAIIPKHTIKSDEPILLDGMIFEELKTRFPVPIYDLDTKGLIEFLATR